MITRRRVIAGSAGALVLCRGAGALEASVDPAAGPDHLAALPGKKPLIRRSFRPPNLETPLADLRQPFTANDAFFVRYHLASIPEVDARTWRLRVGGACSQRTLELSLDDLRRQFEHVTVAAINQCSGNRRGLFTPRAAGIQWGYGAMGNAVWGGVRLRDVLQKAGVAADAVEVVFDGADRPVLPGTPDYLKSVPVQVALDANTLIALQMNGAALPHWNGAPARIVVPGWTATYWVKHVTEIRIEPRAFDGFWMKAGYRVPRNAFPGARFESQDATETTPITEILVNSLITSHEDGQHVDRGAAVELSGWAWDGGRGIRTVEVSTDQGQTWRPAALGKDLGRFAWREFRWPLATQSAGPLQVSVRATSHSGALQPAALTPNPSGYHHNIVQTLALEVR